MSYADTENEHHEAISTGIVALRNEVAKLTASAHNMRGQGLACDDADRARALYESSAAYADAAYRVGLIVNDFEQAESYRAGAMEAIGPVLKYDALEAELVTLRGIREHAISLLTANLPKANAHTALDVLAILLDGRDQQALERLRGEVEAASATQATSHDPQIGELVSGIEWTEHLDTGDQPNAPRLVGNVTHVRYDNTVEISCVRHTEQLGWFRSVAQVARDTIRPANDQETAAHYRSIELFGKQIVDPQLTMAEPEAEQS
jgi:hypothetical protein